MAGIVERAEHGELVARAGDGLAQQVLHAVPLRARLRDDRHAAGDHVAGVDGQVLTRGDMGERQVRAVVGQHVHLAAEQGLERVVGAGEHVHLHVDALFGKIALRIGDGVEDVAVVGGAQAHGRRILGAGDGRSTVRGGGVGGAAAQRQACGGHGGQADEAATGNVVDHGRSFLVANTFACYTEGPPDPSPQRGSKRPG